jgi:hypothetical protein
MAGSLPSRGAARAAAQPIVQYVGFDDVPGRRNYHLTVQVGETVRELTIWIARDAFTRRAAQVQDGPDICFQKILRELGDGGGLGKDATIGVTDGDLASYRQAHQPQPTKRAPRRAFTAEAEEVAATPDEQD